MAACGHPQQVGGAARTVPRVIERHDYLTSAGIAHLLGLDEDQALELIRRTAPVGTVRLNDGTFQVPQAALEQLRAAVPSPARRGPHRPLTLDADARAQLVAAAKRAAERIEEHRTGIATAAADRQDAILALSVGGLSVRQIATELGVSHGVVQAAIKEARKHSGSEAGA